MGSIHGDSAVASQGLVDLAHHRDDCGVELRAGREEHVGVGDHAVLLFLLVRGDELVELVFGTFFTEDSDQALPRFLFLVMQDEPAGRFGQAGRDCEEHDRIYLHDYDWKAPGPLVEFAELVRQEQVDGEGHVEAEDVGLEFLGKGSAAGVVG